MTSSVDRLALYTNGSGSRFIGSLLLICFRTRHSRHLAIIGMRATGRQSFRARLFGAGIMVALLRQAGTTACLSDVLKISAQTSFNRSAQSFKTRPGMLSGPAALHGLTLAQAFITSGAG